MECRKETAYALHKTLITKTIREKEYQFLITTAYCKECGCEVGVKGILDYNAKEIDEQFRKAEGIISTDEIEKLGKIYNLGKLRCLWHWGLASYNTRLSCRTDSFKRIFGYNESCII